MFRRIRTLMLTLFALAFMGQQAVAMPVLLPDPNLYAVRYDDFYSYSAKLMTAWGFDGYDVATGTGGLDLIIYTGAGGANNTNVGAGSAYSFPNPLPGANGGTSTFSGVWGPTGLHSPVPVDTLLAYLNATFGPDVNIPVFNFDMNQTGANPSLEVVAQARIYDAANNVVASWSFDNVNDGIFDPTAWVTAPGSITATNPLDPTDEQTVNNNMGSGKADFIVYAPTMDLSQYSGLGYTFAFDLRMQGLNNGFEELFLTGAFQPAPPPPDAVPEPGTMALLGIGALGAALARRRARKSQA